MLIMDSAILNRFEELAAEVYISLIRDGKMVVGKYNIPSDGEYDLKVVDVSPLNVVIGESKPSCIPEGYHILSLSMILNTRHTFLALLTYAFHESMNTYLDDATR
jgi:hypothetical protein